MKKIAKWFLVAVMCFSFCFSAFAGVSVSSDTDLEFVFENTPSYSQFTWGSGRHWDFSSPVKSFVVGSKTFVFIADSPVEAQFYNDSGGMYTPSPFTQYGNYWLSFSSITNPEDVEQSVTLYDSLTLADVKDFLSYYKGSPDVDTSVFASVPFDYSNHDYVFFYNDNNIPIALFNHKGELRGFLSTTSSNNPYAIRNVSDSFVFKDGSWVADPDNGKKTWSVVFSDLPTVCYSSVDLTRPDGGLYFATKLFDGGSGGETSDGYSPTVPTPANVRYVKKGETSAELVWDNNDPDDKFDVVIRGIFHWKNVNPVGSWIQDNIPFLGDSSGDVAFQLLDSSDDYGVNTCGYSIPPNKFEEIKKEVSKQAAESTPFFSWYPSEFQVQYVGYDENGNKIYGDAAICRINWSNVKKGEWTSSTSIISGAVKDDTGADGEQSTTHVTDWGEIKGGGGAGWGDTTEYDSSGNIVKTDASDNVLSDFINGLVNLPDILNRFFQTLQILMSGISQLPAFFSLVVSFMPLEFTSLLVTGLGVVILLRIFGR